MNLDSTISWREQHDVGSKFHKCLEKKNLFSKKSVFYYLKVCFWNRNKVALEAIIKLIYTSNVKHQRLIRPGYA